MASRQSTSHSCACGNGDASLHHLDALSGAKYDFRVIGLGEWAQYGAIPNPLVDIAFKHEYTDFKPEEATSEERKQTSELIAHVVAAMIEPPLDPDFVRGYRENGSHWEKVSPAMPVEDRLQLWGIQSNPGMLEVYRKFRDQQGSGGVPPSVQDPRPRPRARARNRG